MMMTTTDNPYLQATSIIDSDHPLVIQYTEEAIKNIPDDPTSQAIALYYKVRDDILYNPYLAYHLPETYLSSNLVKIKRGHCVGKAALLCAMGRICNIPSRLGFATVKNHITTQQLSEAMGSNVFVYHGFTEFRLDGKWVAATPAFDQATCERHKVDPLDFDGLSDSKYQSYNKDKELFMEYLESHGSYTDVPLEEMIVAFRREYGDELCDKWIAAFDSMRGFATRKFDQEDVIS